MRKMFAFILFLTANVWCVVQAEYVHKGVPLTISKREVSEQTCLLPEPLAHGRFSNHPRRCPSALDSPACRLEPGTAVPSRWVLYYSCDQHYRLSHNARVSLCQLGQWVPALPACLTEVSVISREGWGGEAVAEFASHVLPVRRVIIAHTATDSCDTKPDCAITVQSIQQYHIQQTGDIGYNFLVGGEGSIFEGQGWSKIGAHTYGFNNGSISIALIGNFVSTEAPERMLSAAKRLIEYGVSSGKIAADYKLNGHCQLIQIASPGRKVFNVIKLWPNWDSVNALRCTQ